MISTVAIFARELRLHDNPLLAEAEQGEFVPVFFFFDDDNRQEHGDASPFF